MSDVLQFLKGTSSRPRVTFYSDGLPTDLDSGVPVVTITRPDGTTIASGTVTHVGAAGSGTYEFTLAAQPQVTLLELRWTGTIGGQPQTLITRVEILGGLLFTMAAFRAMRVANGSPFADDAVPHYSDAQIMEARTAALEEMQAILGFPPVPRYTLEVHDGRTPLLLHQHMQGELLAVTVAGTAQPLANYHLSPTGALRPVSGYSAGVPFPSGYGNVQVEYVSGWQRPYGEGSHWAMIWAARTLNPSGFTNATTISTPDGATYTYERRGGLTGVADLDRWLERHRSLAGVA